MRSSRRLSTTKDRKSTAQDNTPQFAKSIELERRVSRLELQHVEVMEALAVLMQKVTALRAQLDHLAAKITPLS